MSASSGLPMSAPTPGEDFLPEALRREPTAPLNKRTGRNQSE